MNTIRTGDKHSKWENTSQKPSATQQARSKVTEILI